MTDPSKFDEENFKNKSLSYMVAAMMGSLVVLVICIVLAGAIYVLRWAL